MIKETKELIEVRKYVNKFYVSMGQAESINYLSSALDFLDQIISEDFIDEDKKVARNIYEKLLSQIYNKMEYILEDQSVEWETVKYWKDVFEMFGTEGADLAEKIKQMDRKLAEAFTRGYTIAELEDLLKRLQEKNKK